MGMRMIVKSLPVLLIAVFTSSCATSNNAVSKVRPSEKNISLRKIENKNDFPRSTECVDLEKITSRNTPVEIYKSAAKCISQKKYDAAIALNLIAGAYGKFDSYRVKDKTAHQAPVVAMTNSASGVDFKNRLEFSKAMEEFLKKQGEVDILCKRIRKIGQPQYYPQYMLSHGVSGVKASMEGRSVNNALLEISPLSAWEQALKEYLKCPAVD